MGQDFGIIIFIVTGWTRGGFDIWVVMHNAILIE
jgi:hypothetical protein